MRQTLKIGVIGVKQMIGAAFQFLKSQVPQNSSMNLFTNARQDGAGLQSKKHLALQQNMSQTTHKTKTVCVDCLNAFFAHQPVLHESCWLMINSEVPNVRPPQKKENDGSIGA